MSFRWSWICSSYEKITAANLTSVHWYLWGSYWEDGHTLLGCTKEWDNDHKLTWKSFWQNTRINSEDNWKRLPRMPVESVSLEVFEPSIQSSEESGLNSEALNMIWEWVWIRYLSSTKVMKWTSIKYPEWFNDSAILVAAATLRAQKLLDYVLRGLTSPQKIHSARGEPTYMKILAFSSEKELFLQQRACN